MMAPYANLQHMKIAKLLLYVGRRCGNHSRLFQSLSHCKTLLSFVAQCSSKPGFQLTSPMWANTCGDSGLVIDGSICIFP